MSFVTRWNGEYFGWEDGGELYARSGSHIGRVKGRDVFARDGSYLGEIRDDRLITNTAKKGRRWIGFIPSMRVLGPRVSPMNESPREMLPGYEEFPAPDEL